MIGNFLVSLEVQLDISQNSIGSSVTDNRFFLFIDPHYRYPSGKKGEKKDDTNRALVQTNV